MICRALYGIDPLHVAIGDGWIRLLADVALSDRGLPNSLADALLVSLRSAGVSVMATDVLTDPDTARNTLLALVGQLPGNSPRLSRAERVVLNHIISNRPLPCSSVTSTTGFSERLTTDTKAVDCLTHATRYANAATRATIGDEDRIGVNRAFAAWLQANYGTMLYSANPNVLRLHTLTEWLDTECSNDRLMLIVIDGMGLEAWLSFESVWRSAGTIAADSTMRVAFAVLPTLTAMSRRAIFEGRPPSQFSSEKHSAALERRCWIERFPDQGSYFSIAETQGIADDLARGRSRICAVDVSWDDACHSSAAHLYGIPEMAARWAVQTPLAGVIRGALQHGYRVFITSDHGHVRCTGIGRQQAGTLPEERTKRVLIFPTEALAQTYATEQTIAFRPAGLPHDCWPLFANDLGSFDTRGAVCITHGGISIEEAIVPVVEVRKS